MDEVQIEKMLSGERVKIALRTVSNGVLVWIKCKTPKTQPIVHSFLLLRLYK